MVSRTLKVPPADPEDDHEEGSDFFKSLPYFTWTNVVLSHSNFQEMDQESYTDSHCLPLICPISEYTLFYSGCESECNTMEILFQLVNIALSAMQLLLINLIGWFYAKNFKTTEEQKLGLSIWKYFFNSWEAMKQRDIFLTMQYLCIINCYRKHFFFFGIGFRNTVIAFKWRTWFPV